MVKTLFSFIFLLIMMVALSQPEDKKILVIHGGAGNIYPESFSEERAEQYRNKLREALQVGYAVLDSGGTSKDAIVSTIKILEDSPLFNAGRGAVYTHEETVEHDASIMDGATKNSGAIAGVSTVKNPIDLARAVMDSSVHVMMAGNGAIAFAKKQRIEQVDTSYFYNERRLNYLRKVKQQEKDKSNNDRSEINEDNDWHMDQKFGTVGAVALDEKGNLAAATSTGGMTNKKYGRIGDSPIIGAGTYADNETCGVSCTGHGEYFIRHVVAYDIAALMKYKGMSVKEAASYVVKEKLVEAGGDGGVIALDAVGNATMPFNTPGMFRGWVTDDGEIKVFLFGTE